jgi:hypothetical protein
MGEISAELIKDINRIGIQFEEAKIPTLNPVKAYGGEYYIPSDKCKWFEDLIDLYNNSSLHRTIINNLHHRIITNDKDTTPSGTTTTISTTVNPVDELYSKIVYDYLIFGGFSIKIKFDLLHRNIKSLDYLDFSKIRCGNIDDDTLLPSFYFYSNDWNKYNNRKITTYQPYNIDESTEDIQVLYVKRYSAGGSCYPMPSYIAGLEWLYADKELKRYYSNLIKSNFVGNTLLVVPEFNDEAKRKAFDETIQDNFCGSANAGSIMVIEANGGDNLYHNVQIERFNNDPDDTRYQYITDKIDEKISLSHNIPASLLVQFPGKLSNSSDLDVYNKIYNDFVVTPTRNEILMKYNEVKNKLIVI